jgi:hypothetical protein
MMIIRGLKELNAVFFQMGPNDIYVGSVVKKHLEIPMMIDLL